MVRFGGGPAVSHVHECGVCARAAQRLRTRRTRELAAFCDLHTSFQVHYSPTIRFYNLVAYLFLIFFKFIEDLENFNDSPIVPGILFFMKSYSNSKL